ncbi:MAG: YciI family protein, partial [Gemmatimonadales bacterium]
PADSSDVAKRLAGPVEPPPDLKQRVTGSLRERGLVAPVGGRRARFFTTFAYVAGAVLLFVGGLMFGKRSGSTAADPRPRFVLLLYEDAAFRPTVSHLEHVAEYGAWADSLRGQGKLVMGEELDTGESAVLRGAGTVTRVSPGDLQSEAGILGGFFIVRAANREEALAIARQCPHLKYGGRIVLRRFTMT